MEKRFAVIAVLEELDKSLKVAEKVLPQFFGRVTRLKNSKDNSNEKNKQIISGISRKMLMNNLTLEYEFYEYVKQRLHFQYNKFFLS